MNSKSVYITLLVTLLFISCTKEEEDDPLNPSADSREKFTGSWLCSETINSSLSTFTIEFVNLGDADSVYIYNFANTGTSQKAVGLVSGNSLTIPNQTIGITPVPVNGTGVLNSSNNKITLNYTYDGDAASATCTR